MFSITQWCNGYHYRKLPSTKPKPRFCAGSNPDQGMSDICDDEKSQTVVPTGNKA